MGAPGALSAGDAAASIWSGLASAEAVFPWAIGAVRRLRAVDRHAAGRLAVEAKMIERCHEDLKRRGRHVLGCDPKRRGLLSREAVASIVVVSSEAFEPLRPEPDHARIARSLGDRRATRDFGLAKKATEQSAAAARRDNSLDVYQGGDRRFPASSKKEVTSHVQ